MFELETGAQHLNGWEALVVIAVILFFGWLCWLANRR